MLQASIEFMYLVVQSTLYVCVVYFSANFYRGPEQFFWVLPCSPACLQLTTATTWLARA